MRHPRSTPSVRSATSLPLAFPSSAWERGEKSSQISQLANREWVAVETIINEKVVRENHPPCSKGLGAEGIIEYPLNKLVY